MTVPTWSRSRPLACLAVCLLALGGCRSADAATVGDISITRAALDRELDAILGNEDYLFNLERKAGVPIRDADGGFTPHLVAQVLTNEIKRSATSKITRDRRVRPTEEERTQGLVTAQGAVGHRDTLAAFPGWYREKLVEYETNVIALVRALTDQTPEQYYGRAKDSFQRSCAWHIATETLEQAAAARRRVEAGESFGSVARSVSRDEKTAPRGGELGCSARGDLEPLLDELAFTLPIDEVSQPENIGGAYHLLLVSSRKTPPLEEIRGEIDAALRGLGAANFDSLLKETLTTARVSVADDIGKWDPSRLTVLPPTVEPQGPTPTPRPRPLPRVATSSDQVDPNYHVGQQIFITDEGFKPRELVSVVEEKITWINETDAPKTIRFAAGGHTIGPIDAGESDSHTPEGAITIAYALADDTHVKGTVFIQAYFAPGEDPGAPDRLDADTPIPGIATPWKPEDSG